LKVKGLGLLAMAAHPDMAFAAKAEKRPNILWLFIEDQGVDGVRSHITTF